MVRSTLFIFSVGSWKTKMVNQKVDVEEFPHLHVWMASRRTHISARSLKKWRPRSEEQPLLYSSLKRNFNQTCYCFSTLVVVSFPLLLLPSSSSSSFLLYFFFLLLLLLRSCETAELQKSSITLPPSQSHRQRSLSVTLRCQTVFHKNLKCNSAVKIHSKYSQYAQSSMVFPLFAEKEASNRFRLV